MGKTRAQKLQEKIKLASIDEEAIVWKWFDEHVEPELIKSKGKL